ncbi:MAG: hypothetical protein R2729_04005 [Bryobacteraceae bacterium]
MLAGAGTVEAGDSDTLQHAALYLDRAAARLEQFVAALENGSDKEIDLALKAYTREFSRFHVTVGRLQIDKQTSGFVTRAGSEIELQISRLDAVDQRIPKKRKAAFIEARNHLKSAQRMLAGKFASLSGNHPFKMKGAGPEAPGARVFQ